MLAHVSTHLCALRRTTHKDQTRHPVAASCVQGQVEQNKAKPIIAKPLRVKWR